MAVITDHISAGGYFAGLLTSSPSISMPRSTLGVKKQQMGNGLPTGAPGHSSHCFPPVNSVTKSHSTRGFLAIHAQNGFCDPPNGVEDKSPVRAVKTLIMKSSRRSCREEMKGAWN